MMIVAFLIITVVNLILALSGLVYPEADKWLYFLIIEKTAFWTFLIIGIGMEYFGFILITLMNSIYLAGSDYNYAWQVFFAVELYACLFILVGLFKSSKRAKEEQAERELKELRKKRLDLEGKDVISVISELTSKGSYGSGSDINITHKLVLTVDAKTPEGNAFTCEIPVDVKYFDLPAFQPGSRVKIRYIPGDSSICEFVEALDKPQVSTPPVQEAPKQRPVVCPFCKSHFDLSGNSVCPNCRAPYVN